MRVLMLAAAVFAATAVLAAEAPSGKNLGAVTGGEFGEAKRLIDDKCLTCHNRKVIEAAVQKKKDMEKIVRQMEGKGVALTDRERLVLQHFWTAKAFRE